MSKDEYPIADYALIGNCETAALVNPDGGIDWLCLPAFDAPSFLGALLDRRKAGEFFIRPTGDYRVIRNYCEDTAILQTRFLGAEGWTVKLTDFFVIARAPDARFYDFTSLHPTRKLVRIVEVEDGDAVTLEARLSARPDYGRENPRWTPVDGGFECPEAAVYSSTPLELDDGDLAATFPLGRARQRDLGAPGAEPPHLQQGRRLVGLRSGSRTRADERRGGRRSMRKNPQASP